MSPSHKKDSSLTGPLRLIRTRYVQRSTTALRSWFNEAILKRKAEISEILEDTSGDMNVDTLKRDVFTRIALASQMDGKFRLEDSEIVWTFISLP
jgi:hypothetical protein